MPVTEFARADVVTAEPEDTLEEIARVMTDAGVGSVVVVEDGRPCGMITDRDLVTYGLAGDRDPHTAIANDIMAMDVVTVDADASVLEAVRTMGEAGVRRVPVVDGGELVGIVALDDFVVVLASELASLARVVASESPPRP